MVRLLGITSILFAFFLTPSLADHPTKHHHGSHELPLTDKEQHWLYGHQSIRFTGDPNWLPYEAFTKEGDYIGIVAKILDRLSGQTGVEFKRIPSQSWSNALDMVSHLEVDVISGDLADETIRSTHNFTQPYLERPLIVVMLGDQKDYISNLYDIANKKIAIIKDYGYTWEVSKKYQDIPIIQVENIQDGLEGVAKGDYDAFVASDALARFHINQLNLNQLHIVGQLPIVMKIGLGVRKDWPELLSILDKGLATIPSRERHELVGEWLLQEYSNRTDYRLVWKVIAIAGVLMMLVLFRIRYLQKQRKQLRETQEKLRLLSEEAQQANRAKSRFLANMSHEIRTPMNAVIGMTYLALQVNPKPETRNYLEKIQNSASLLLGILNDILDFSKIEAGKLHLDHSTFNLLDVVDRLNSLTTVEADYKGLKRNIVVDSNIPVWLKGDPIRLGQVLLNLCQNAIKFTDQGEVTVTASFEGKQDDKIKVHFLIKDTGIGIKKEEQKKLFEAFEQAEDSNARRHNGTGLGLPISQHLIEQMGGELAVKSVLGKGTEFFFTLEFDQADEADIVQQTKETPEIKDLIGHVLVVEDNKINQEVIIGLLKNFSLKVNVVNNGQEGVDAVNAANNYDLVLMDIQMPVMDGLEACKHIRTKHDIDSLPIVAMTADAMESDQKRSLAAGMNAHLNKPISPDILYRTLAKFLPTGSLPETAPLTILDINQGLKNVAGQNELLIRLLKRFKEEHANDAVTIRSALSHGNSDEAQRLIHTLKGVTGTIGAKALHETIKTFNKEELTEDNLEQLETMLKDLSLEIEIYLPLEANNPSK